MLERYRAINYGTLNKFASQFLFTLVHYLKEFLNLDIIFQYLAFKINDIIKYIKLRK